MDLLHNIKDKIEDLVHDTPLDALFTNDFMKKFTNFASLPDMMKSFGIEPKNLSELKNIPGLDDKIKGATQFSNLKEMLAKATEMLKKH